ncbi:MAG: hypothetical protein VKJ64_20975 [Leptolyngbyaceae bacterium]|nr:hypothetical protein [Leptolyngbyaceae bacterium]
MHTLLMEITASGPSFPWYFVLVYVVGFIAAVGIGSLAWYNSKRPAGWEAAKRPDNIPDLSKSINPKGDAEDS